MRAERSRLRYGFAAFEDRYTTMPEPGLELSQDDREVWLGWQLSRPVPFGGAFEVGVEGRRRWPEHDIGIGLGWRLDDPGGGNLGVEARIKARRRRGVDAISGLRRDRLRDEAGWLRAALPGSGRTRVCKGGVVQALPSSAASAGRVDAGAPA